MTVDEFNDKWKNHLEEGFEGLEFSDAEGKVVDWLDKHFVNKSRVYLCAN